MILALADIANKTQKYINSKEKDIILDIGANDGTFLGMFPNKYIRIGIDPAQNLKQYYQNKCEHYIEDFFSAEKYWSVAKEKAKIIAQILKG